MKHSPVAPSTKLIVEDKEYELLFDFEAIARAEDLTGKALLSGINLNQREYRTPSISLIRNMLFASISALHPEITLSEAKAIVTKHNYMYVWSTVMDAWVKGLSEPDPEEVKKENPQTDQN